MNQISYKFEIGPIEMNHVRNVDSIARKTIESNPNTNSIFIYARHACAKLERKQDLDLIEIQSFFDVIGQFYQATKLAKNQNLATQETLDHAKELMRFAIRLETQIPQTKKFNFGPVS